MKKLIVLPGSIDCSFFLNELDNLKKNFDFVKIISYKNDENYTEMSKKIGMHYEMIDWKNIKVIFSFDVIRWLLGPEVLKEVMQFCVFKKNGMKKIIYILIYGLFYLQAQKVIDSELSKANVEDEIYLYSYWLSRPAYVISKYNKKRKGNIKRIFSRAHGYDLYLYRNQLNYIPFRSFIDENLDNIYFISQDGLDYFEKNITKKRSNHSKRTSNKSVERLGTFGNYEIKEIQEKDYVCIASCSRVIELKRIDLIIDFIKKIVDANCKVRWIHLGNGPEIDRIKQYAYSKLNEIDYFFLGYVANEEILNIYKNYDVDFFINMSDYEGIPVSIMEALSIGIPTIARNVGANSEIVNHTNGFLINDITNEDEISTLITFVRQRIYDIEKYSAYSANARTSWEKEYNAELNYNNFIKSLWRE